MVCQSVVSVTVLSLIRTVRLADFVLATDQQTHRAGNTFGFTTTRYLRWPSAAPACCCWRKCLRAGSGRPVQPDPLSRPRNRQGHRLDTEYRAVLPCRKSKFGIRLSPALRANPAHSPDLSAAGSVVSFLPASVTRLSTEVSAVASAFFDTLLLVVFRLFCRFVSCWLCEVIAPSAVC